MSSIVNELGDVPLAYDRLDISGNTPGFSSAAVFDNTSEKVAACGEVWHPTVKTGTINIRKVHFRVGAKTLNVASVVRVSLQNLTAATGPPLQPDGTQDQTADMTALTANAYNSTGNLSADRAVDLSADSIGDANSRWLAVVWEYQTFNASDSVVISAVSGIFNPLNAGVGLFTASWAWNPSTAMTSVVLECDDGTFAFLRGFPPFSALGTQVNVSSNGAFRRGGLKLKFPTERTVNRFGIYMNAGTGADGRIVLYDSDGTTELRSVDVDANALVANAFRVVEVEFPPATLAADTFYRLVWVGGTTTAATIFVGDVSAAGHMDGLIYGQNMHWTTADSGGAWTDTTTRRPHFALGCSGFHDGSGGGGGMLVNPGMNGRKV